MWENRIHLTPSFAELHGKMNVEFTYDTDMMKWIQWPYSEDFGWSSPEFLRRFGYFEGIGPYPDIEVLKGFVPCREEEKEEDEVRQDFSPMHVDDHNRCSPELSDDMLLLTSNDALRLEEDCLFESEPSLPGRGVKTRGGAVTADRFLCQKNSLADMTLAQLNDSNASDMSYRLEYAALKTEIYQMPKIDSLRTISYSPRAQFVIPASKSQQVSQPPVLCGTSSSSSSSSSSKKASVYIKKEKEDCDEFNVVIKTEVTCSVGSIKKRKAEKISRASSINSTFGDFDEKNDVKHHIRKLENHLQSSSSSSSSGQSSASSSSYCPPLEKKIKLEMSRTDSVCDQNGSLNDIISPEKSSLIEDSEVAETDLSDAESVLSRGSSSLDQNRPPGGADKRFFWQYNTQAKGPKEKRLCKNIGASDPHVLKDFEDPVFDPGHGNVHFVHSGKARKGDGTDITPNPEKLLQLGNELKSLNRIINRMTATSESGTTTTRMMTTTKEKNKYASRICRLKKKAQHEANKIKLHGLNNEHSQLMQVLNGIKLKMKQQQPHKTPPPASASAAKKTNYAEELNTLVRSYLKATVAGHADDYVSSVLMSLTTDGDDQKDTWLYSD